MNAREVLKRLESGEVDGVVAELKAEVGLPRHPKRMLQTARDIREFEERFYMPEWLRGARHAEAAKLLDPEALSCGMSGCIGGFVTARAGGEATTERVAGWFGITDEQAKRLCVWTSTGGADGVWPRGTGLDEIAALTAAKVLEVWATEGFAEAKRVAAEMMKPKDGEEISR